MSLLTEELPAKERVLPTGHVRPNPPAADATVPATAGTEPAKPVWIDRGRIPCLDGLRALSIALVFIEHGSMTAFTLPRTTLGKLVGHVGGIGVDVFFAISGFLITLLLLREVRRTDDINLRGFYARRFLRLMPAAVVFLATVFVLQLMGRAHVDGRTWLHVLTYTVNFDPRPAWAVGHLWSLSIEEQFYFVWPLALWLLGPKRSLVLAVAWLAAAPVARLALLKLYPHDMGRFENWTPWRVDCIAAGCALALVAGSPELRRWTRLGRPAAMLVLAAAALTIFASFAVGTRISLYGVALDPSVRAACITAIIWFTINHAGGGWGRLLESKPLVTVGLLSYSLYLWQQLFLNPHGRSWANDLPVSVALAVLAAVASYLLVERPFLRLKDRLDKRHAAAPAGARVAG